MKTLATILLFSIVVFAQTPLLQLFKIPLLVEHFLAHQEKDTASFLNFLEDHYSANHEDNDWQEDNQLPFKSIPGYAFNNAIIPTINKTSAIIPAVAEKIIIDYFAPVLQQQLSSIFHPPRV
jgi:hypothetical protein